MTLAEGNPNRTDHRPAVIPAQIMLRGYATPASINDWGQGKNRAICAGVSSYGDKGCMTEGSLAAVANEKLCAQSCQDVIIVV